MIEKKKHYDFIEIGTSDFNTLIELSDNETTGISVEPIKYYIDKLPNKNNVIKVQSALSTTDGDVDVYYIDEQKITDNNLPWWVRGSNSINNPHPFAIKELGEELYNSLVTIEKVPTISWKTLIETYGVESIGYLKIDAEGHDHIIMRDFLNYCKEHSFPTPNKITLEYHDGVSNKLEIDKLVSELSGYELIKEVSDITLFKPQIPRIIHQTYKNNDLPLEIAKVVNELKTMNPTFEYRFYTDEDCIEFIKNNYDEETLNLYLSINPIYGSSRADFFRYLLMYKVGGVYLDIKSCTTVPLEKTLLPTDEYLLTHWKGLDWVDELNYRFGEFQNWHIICRPNHPFLSRVIEIVKENIKNYLGGSNKDTVLRVTGPIAYSKGIIELISKYKTNYVDSPVREFLLENEIGLKYIQTPIHHHKLYGKSFSRVEPLIIKEKVDKAYVLYSTENYFDIVSTCVKSIREYSDLPIFVYLMNSDLKIDIKDVVTLRWDLDIDESDDSLMYINSKDNFYINRNNKKIYKILIQRPLITKDVLEKYAKTVAYIDSDSIATPYADSIFKLTESKNYPYFVQGIYEYLLVGDRGGAVSRDDLSTTLEHPACELFGVNQYVRDKYRQTGYYVANENCIDFLNEWYEMCIHPTVLGNIPYYAAYNEETILNVLLWKKKILDGLPYIYTNGGSDFVDRVYSDSNIDESELWVKLPKNKENLLFFHGEKRIPEMNKMIQKIKRYHDGKKRILFLAPHLSTGGMPSFLLKRVESLLEYSKELELYVVEYSNHSDHFVVQKNKIKELLPSSHFWTLGQDKMELVKIIEENEFDIIHLDEMIEAFDFHNPMTPELMNYLYKNDRTWRMVETCHNIIFKPNLEKHFHPESYAYCTPWHKENTFKQMPSYGEVIEFPIEDKIPSSTEKIEAKLKLGFDLNKKHVINVGLWTSGKNQKEGVELARLIEKTNPEYQFHFIGNQAPNFQDYWQPIMKDLPSNVKVWGERNDVDLFLTAADIFMFNSTWECNPLVLRESISYGLPTLSRNLPQYMDMFTNHIYSINSDLHLTKEVLLSIDTIRDTIHDTIHDTDQVKLFAEKHSNLYSKIINEKINEQKMMNSEIQVFQHFVNNPFLEIKGNTDKTYKIEFFDEQGINHYTNEIKVNHWVKLNRSYYTKWRARVSHNNQTIYEESLNFENKRVYISFDSKSLGDTVAWAPYLLEFKKKHNCHVVASTYWNKFFKETYPEIEFIEPGTVVNNINGMYKIGWFYDVDKEPEMPNTIPLQKAVTNILGLDFKEIKPNINYELGQSPYNQKYVTIATNSTAGCKFWTREGWQELINYLHSQGYLVVNVSKEDNPFKNAFKINDTSIENTMRTIHHSEFFIGLSSGLSWLAWALGKHVVMISNFTEPDHEFTTNCTRIVKLDVCNGCWNSPIYKFDKGDWDWCPVHKGTNRQFECHKTITPQMVIDQIQHLL
jgi:autotransporter strand-loop-strand O-heptosyltransferase